MFRLTRHLVAHLFATMVVLSLVVAGHLALGLATGPWSVVSEQEDVSAESLDSEKGPSDGQEREVEEDSEIELFARMGEAVVPHCAAPSEQQLCRPPLAAPCGRSPEIIIFRPPRA